ncbi:OmpH family outer membrane protein [Marinobacterium stanieri]|uniref:Periplasmic chaperone for outer membrane proteins Skp n=1 Tax=Marinobacterium stanieri TaxID=49186 RepID=A0A1N6VBA8_9GAMM|nr:OmpH family outer membrane protein [Marinobacterium stanieri]SIQ75009.1 periplasmic chaperone for outer membrane proteins Skp [Marinobacterium stanieri]
MKLVTRIAALVVVLFSAQAMAEKVAVLGVEEALLNSNAAKSFREELKAEFADEEKQLVALEKQARELRDKLQKNAGLASEEDLKQMRMQFQKAFGEYQRRGQAMQQQRGQREQAFIAEMRPRLDKAIRELLDTEGYDLILSKQATVYANKDTDLTPRVIELLNKQ